MNEVHSEPILPDSKLHYGMLLVSIMCQISDKLPTDYLSVAHAFLQSDRGSRYLNILLS
jgi:hypothetical protein